MWRSIQLTTVLLSSVVAVWGADPVLGTWRLNAAKSQYHPGPLPRGQTRIYEKDGPGVKATVITVNPDGKSVTVHYPTNYDGKVYPVLGSPDTDGIVMRRIDDYTAESTLMHAGILMGTARRVIAPDGKTMTITFKGTVPGGDQVNNTGFYEKQ